MSAINARFVGPWRMYIGIEHFVLDADTIEEALEKVEAKYGSKYHQRLARSGISEKRRICDDSNILLNRVNIRQIKDRSLKDGDKIDIIPRFVGG